MLDQLPEWMQQATVRSQLPSWMQDPPPKKPRSVLDRMSQQLLALDKFVRRQTGQMVEGASHLPEAAVREVKDMAAEAKRDPMRFYMGLVGPGELAGLAERKVAQAAMRFHVPGEAEPRLFTGPTHVHARLQAEDALGDLLDQNFEPRFKEESGFVDNLGGWLSRQDALGVAKKNKQIGGNLRAQDAVKRSGELKSEVLTPANAYAEANPLQGLIGKDHNPDVLTVVQRLLRNDPMKRVTAVDAERAAHMAKVYESLPKNDPAARSAYDALNAEVADQMKAIKDAGYKIEYVTKDPYANSAEMMKDVRENKRLKVFKTPDDSFHPYMTPAQNDAFRAVHDWIAHSGPGNQFGPIGEENAYRMHAATLSPEAQRALATETRGQNSWVNYGPNAHLPVKERPFAEQKAALWPADLLGDYDAMPVASEAEIGAPAIHIPADEWTPTERGVFNRNAPKLQGTAEPDPRLFAKMKTGQPSELSQAISESPVVEGGLLDDALRGLPKGGREWYELGPLWQYFQEHEGPFSFADWVHASGAGSVQNPTHNELATASSLLFAKKRGIDWEMVKQIQQQMHPKEKNLWLGADIEKIFNRASREGILLPPSPGAAERKVPWYSQGKMGGSRLSLPALDTHERRRLTQLAAQDENIRKMLEVLQVRDKKGRVRPMRLEGANADVIPIGNALDYETLSQPYMRGANMLDLPSSQAFQAGRWLGGGEHTGLMSAPFGDYMQTLEDGLLYTARLRGLDESPAGLRKLAKSIFSGDEFFAPVYSRKGGFPGVTGH